MTRTNFKFGKGFGFINSLAATKVAEIVVDPLMKLKLNVERLLKEYTPPDHVVTELDLTWKGGLWRMALEAALGVQYLHHHRYEQASAKEELARPLLFSLAYRWPVPVMVQVLHPERRLQRHPPQPPLPRQVQLLHPVLRRLVLLQQPLRVQL